jgi:hypothetical protein
MPDCRRMVLHYIYLFRKNHYPRSSLVQINGLTVDNNINDLDTNYSKLSFNDEFCFYLIYL